MTKAPPHAWVPLMDHLYYALHDYRTCKRVGLKQIGLHRRRALALIAQIKGRS